MFLPLKIPDPGCSGYDCEEDDTHLQCFLNAEVQNLEVLLAHDYCWIHQACASEYAAEAIQ